MSTINKTKLETKESYRRRPSLVINAISNWVALGVSIIVGFLLTPYIIKCLGTAQYGIWMLIGSVIGYYGLLDLGVTSALMRYVSRHAGQKDYDAVNEVVNTALIFFSIVGGIIIIVSLFIADPLASFFNIEVGDRILFKRVVWLLGISAGLMLPGNVLSVIILAHERFVAANTVKIVIAVLRGILSFYILYQGGGLVGIGWINVGLSVFLIVTNLAIIKTCFKHINFLLKMANKSSARALLSFGFFMSIVHIGNMLRFKLDAAVIGKFLNMDSVGIYGVAALLFGYVLSTAISCSGVTQPRLSALAAKNQNAFRDAILDYSNLVAVLAAGVGAVGISLAHDFMQLWLPWNIENVKGATTVFIILSVGLVPELMTDVSKNALQAVKKHPYYAYQTIGEGIANLVLSVILVFRLGIYGVALGTAIPALITKLVIQPLYCCRIFKIDWPTYVLRVLLKPLLVAGFVICLECNRMIFHATSYMQLVLKGSLAVLVYLILAYKFCLNHRNQQLVRSYLKMIRTRMAQSSVSR